MDNTIKLLTLVEIMCHRLIMSFQLPKLSYLKILIQKEKI